MSNIFNATLIEAVGKTLVAVGSHSPEWLVTKTPFMSYVLKSMLRVADLEGRTRSEFERNQRVVERLGFHESQFDMPGLEWGERGGYRYPFVLATWKERVEYMEERHRIQAVPVLLAQTDHIFRRRKSPSAALPKDGLLDWLRGCLRNTPVHWYTTRSGTPGGPRGLEVDFATFCDEVEHESSDCKYNVRDLALTDDGQLTINARTNLSSVLKVTSSERDADRRNVEHSAFLALTLIQQANQVSYHNWIHFYFNDLVLFNVRSHFPRGHWVRKLLDPHMKYQNVLNHAGLFSRFPSDVRPNEIWDDILFGGNLSSWTMGTFNQNIVDKSLGYYRNADFSRACDETRGLNFNLNRLVAEPDNEMKGLVDDLDKKILAFVGEVIDRSATEVDDRTLSLVSNNVLKFLRPDCLDSIPDGDKNTRGIFKRIIGRYMLQAGIVHCLEHFSMYAWNAPLRLPQRIRQMFDTSLSLDDYSYEIDKQNGSFGHELFTRYIPNADDRGNWQTLSYGFDNLGTEALSRSFIASVQNALIDYDTRVMKPAREKLMASGIAVNESCVLTPGRIGCSIKM